MLPLEDERFMPDHDERFMDGTTNTTVGAVFGRSTRSVAWGFFAGGTLGFVLGLLLAPQEGRKTQRRIIYQLEHLAGQAAILADNLLKPHERGEARRSGDALVADARERAERIHEDIDALLTEMRRHDRPSASAVD